MPTADNPGGSGAGFFAGLLKGFGSTVLQISQQDRALEAKHQEQMVNVLADAYHKEDLDAEPALKGIAAILSAPLSAFGGGKKGKGGKGGGFDIASLLTDPEQLGTLLVGAHKALQGGAERPLPGTGPVAVGAGQPPAAASKTSLGHVGQRDDTGDAAGSTTLEQVGRTEQPPLSARSTEVQNTPRSSPFRTRTQKLAEAQQQYEAQKAIDFKYEAELEKVKAKYRKNNLSVVNRPTQDADGNWYLPVMDHETGQVISRIPTQAPKETAATATGSFSDYVKKWEDDNGPADADKIVELRDKFFKAGKYAPQNSNAAMGDIPAIMTNADRPSGPEANRIDPATGATPNSVYQDALTYGLTGRSPSMGLGSAAQVRARRAAISAKAAAMASAAGVDLPTLQAEYKANSAALTRLVPLFAATSASAGTAKDNLQLAVDQSDKVPRTGSPMVNRYLQWANGQQLTGNPNLTTFETYIYTAAREYAKVTSGSAASVAGLTDSASKKADELLNAAQTPAAFKAAADAMQNDMANVTKNQGEQINQTSKVIGRLLGTPPPTGTTRMRAPADAGGQISEVPNDQVEHFRSLGATVVQ